MKKGTVERREISLLPPGYFSNPSIRHKILFSRIM